MTLLSHLHETVTVNGVAFDLHTGRYADGTLHPQGWRYVSGFDPLPTPTWQYDFPSGLRIVKRVLMAPGKNTVYVTYMRVGGGDDVTLTVAPLTGWKDYHSEMRPWDGFPVRQGFVPTGYEIQATPDAPTLRLMLAGAKWTRAGWWHTNVFHEREAERGQDAVEDLYCPATATVTLDKQVESVTFVATIEREEPRLASLVLGDIVREQNALVANAGIAPDNDAARTLCITADKFVVRASGDERGTILAGYPWFTDWGRDTFIALPGICLATRRYEVAREILLSFVPFVSQGMIPNRFPDTYELPDYNTADATGWFVHACGAYHKATGDTAFVQTLAPVLAEIVAWHETGTRYKIGVDAHDGLLSAGENGTQLTWMDAKIGDYVVTPRIGKPVEINALWIHTLRVAADFTGDAVYTKKADRAAQSFCKAFVRPDGLGLYDNIAPDGTPDPAIRPNQIFAVSLCEGLLSDAVAKAVVDTVTRELWTPVGLRTLSPHDPAYRPRYEGNGFSRDSAYHQGTVWAWLLGAYWDARRRVYNDAPDVTEIVAGLNDYGVGGVAEIFDANAPHQPDGCPWQAWSVAEVLRLMLQREKTTYGVAVP